MCSFGNYFQFDDTAPKFELLNQLSEKSKLSVLSRSPFLFVFLLSILSQYVLTQLCQAVYPLRTIDRPVFLRLGNMRVSNCMLSHILIFIITVGPFNLFLKYMFNHMKLYCTYSSFLVCFITSIHHHLHCYHRIGHFFSFFLTSFESMLMLQEAIIILINMIYIFNY